MKLPLSLAAVTWAIADGAFFDDATVEHGPIDHARMIPMGIALLLSLRFALLVLVYGLASGRIPSATAASMTITSSLCWVVLLLPFILQLIR
jgi:hypothetical protein